LALLALDEGRFRIVERLKLAALQEISARVHRNFFNDPPLGSLQLLLLVFELRLLPDLGRRAFALGFGLLQIAERYWNVFPLVPLRAVVMHPVPVDLVFARHLIIAILQKQLEGTAERQRDSEHE